MRAIEPMQPPHSSNGSSAKIPIAPVPRCCNDLALANEQNHTAGLSASTLYRFLRARGLTERQLLQDKAAAHKKYEAQFCQSDLAVRHAVRSLGRTLGRR